MKVTYGSRRVEVPDPSPEELAAISRKRNIIDPTQAGLLGVYRAGVLAAIREIENTRGARLENLLMEDRK